LENQLPNNPVLPIPIKVLFHANCDDGFGAAWAAYKFYTEVGVINSVEFIPVKYGDIPPQNLEGTSVLIVDFSYPRDTLQKIRDISKSLTVLDHHKTAQKDLEGFPNCVFDMGRSGAVITWNYLFPQRPVPRLLQYIQDNDLWKHELPHCQTVIRLIRSYPHDFELWDNLAFQLNTNEDLIISIASNIERYFQQQVEFNKVNAVRIKYKEIESAIININVTFVSETLHKLCKELSIPMAFGWYMDSNEEIILSIRGDGSVDVSAIAKTYGGGGHNNAAGFKLSHREFRQFLKDWESDL
jgi:oligoribonuclease NrnB/cAMP/cGMP phosphodiesterase (DHH superfamily)